MEIVKKLIIIVNIEIIFQTVRTIKSEPSLNIASAAGQIIKPAATRDEPMEISDSGIRLKGSLFESNTKAIVWGQQTKAIQVSVLTVLENLHLFLKRCANSFKFQGMLDFDFVCGRSQPSVVASTYPFIGDHKQKYYFGQKVSSNVTFPYLYCFL